MNLVSNLDYTPASGEHVLKTYSDVSANTVSSGGQFAYTPDYHDIPAIGTGTTYVYPKGMFVGGSTIISTQQFGHTCINATQVWPPIIAMKLDTIAYVNNEILINCDVPYFITEPTYARQGAFRITYAFTSGTKPNCTYQMYDSYVTKSFPSSNTSKTVWIHGATIHIKNEPNCRYKLYGYDDYECLNKADLMPGYFTHLEFLSPAEPIAKTTPTISGYLFDHNVTTHVSRRQYYIGEDSMININANIGTGTTYYGKKFRFYYNNAPMFHESVMWLEPPFNRVTYMLFNKQRLSGSTATPCNIVGEYCQGTNYINTYHGPIIASVALQYVTQYGGGHASPTFIVPSNNLLGPVSHHHELPNGEPAVEFSSFYLGESNSTSSKITGIQYKKTTANGNELLSSHRGWKQFPLIQGCLGNPNQYATIRIENPHTAPTGIDTGRIAVLGGGVGMPRKILAYSASQMNLPATVTVQKTTTTETHYLSGLAMTAQTPTVFDAESMALGTYVYFYPYITMLVAYQLARSDCKCNFIYATYTTSAPICARVVQYAYNNGSPGSGSGTGTGGGTDN